MPCMDAGAVGTSTTTQGTGTISMSNVQCVGSESRLVDCRRIELSERHCSHTSDAGVKCHERTGESQ